MKFKATNQQVKQIAANAINASKPMGMGFLHFQADNNFTADDIEDGELYFDYVQGRMVKLRIRDLGNGEYEIADNPTSDYQSWCSTYPTTEALVNSVLAVVA
jgi:hypothetical protein